MAADPTRGVARTRSTRLLIWPVTILVLAGTLVGAAGTSAVTNPNPAATAVFRLSGGDVAAARGLARYGYVVLNAWNADRIPRLKKRNPGIQVLVYKDMASTRGYAVRGRIDDPLLPTGVGFAYADSRHPEWFLEDTAGKRVEWSGYSSHWWMDVGDSGYQQAWLDNVAAELRAKGWDGVAIDNAMADPSHYLGERTLARYPTRSDYQAATRSFLARVGPSLVARGFLVLPNISDADPDTWNDWIQFTSGGILEHWTKWSGAAAGSGYIDGASWLRHARLMTDTQAQGKVFLANTGSTSMADTRTMRYARASFLLWWNGGPSALSFSVAAADPWSPEWTTDVGVPAAPAYEVGGAWRRDYSAGTVLANPRTITVTVDLGAAYLTPDGASSTQVTLEPTSGLVLRTAPPG